MFLDAEYPIVSVNDWIPVIDLKSGEERGQLKVTLAMGVEAQITRLIGDFMRTKPPPTRPDNPNSHSDDDSHIYDSVNETESSSRASGTEDPVPPVVPEPPIEGNTSSSSEEEEGGGEDHKVSPSYFSALVEIEQGQGLAGVSNGRGGKAPPSTYLTFASRNPSTVATGIVRGSSNPRWSFRRKLDIARDVLTDPRRHFILKLWHHRADDKVVDLERDHVLGFVAVDLTPLCLSGFPLITGWYNVMDFVGRCRGHVKVTITPSDDLSSIPVPRDLWRRESEIGFPPTASDKLWYVTSASYSKFPSHIARYTEQTISPSPPPPPAPDIPTSPSPPLPPKEASFHMRGLIDNLPSVSESFLERKLSDLAETTRELKGRLEVRESSHYGQQASHETVGDDISDPSRLTSEQLQTAIETRIKEMRDRARVGELEQGEDEGGSRGSDSDGMEVIDLATSGSERTTPDLSGVSAEIAGILGQGGTDAGAGTQNPDLLPELGNLDLSRLLAADPAVAVTDTQAGAQSRQGPEGGNPTEEDRIASSRRAAAKSKDTRDMEN